MVEVSRSEFEGMVGDALDEIPPELAAAMENVVVLVDEWPSADQLAVAGVGPSTTLFGLYEGVPMTERGPISYAGVTPDRITIFRGPLQRHARDRAELAAQVRVTVLHEVGHAFGIDDDRLDQLGWA